VTEEWKEEVRQSLPELPHAREQRFQTEYALPRQDASVLTALRDSADYFEQTAKACGEPKLAANWVLNDLSYLLQENGKEIHESPVRPENLAGLIKLIAGNTISGKMAKDVLAEMFKTGKSASQIVSDKGLEQITDPDKIAVVAREIIAANPRQAEQYRQGKTATIGWFVGQVMKATRGQAQPKLVQEVLRKELS
jgi:aspartyl-tRNA(Asn)/glutamyl-tRNA(Gln) amidotransferase subunit B